jgi:tRNA pseudouridine55 synthase
VRATEPTPAAGLLVDKPAGVTSHDVVAEIRRESGSKVGHAGTLDPFATGLLVILLGRATRLQRYLLRLPKTYRATARLGWHSSTADPDGELTETGRIPERLELPTGEIEQRVPMTSAVKVDGERLYRKAHRGEEIETPMRRVTIHRAELIESDGERATFEIECSSGTYIRTLIETLGDAYCESLRRTAIGDLHVPDEGRAEVSPAELMGFLPERLLDDDEATAVGHGRPVVEPFDIPPEHVRLTHDGRLVAVARVDGENLQPEVVLV